jgi:hypothetical protein
MKIDTFLSKNCMFFQKIGTFFHPLYKGFQRVVTGSFTLNKGLSTTNIIIINNITNNNSNNNNKSYIVKLHTRTAHI